MNAVLNTLDAITEEDRAVLGEHCDELVVAALGATGTLGAIFRRRQLAVASYHPVTFDALSDEEAARALAVGMRVGLIRMHDYTPPGTYMVAEEDLRGHMVGMLDSLPDLPTLLAGRSV